MKRSYRNILICLGAALLTMAFQCPKDYPPPTPAYAYHEKLTLTPYKKSYAINDTIWVQFQTADKTLFDNLSGNRVSTDTTYLQAGFSLLRRYPGGNTVGLFSDVKVENGLNVIFEALSFGNNDVSFTTDCSQNPYFFRVGFIPKLTGVYSIHPRGDASPCPNKMHRPYSTFRFTFDLADCNKDVWLSIPPASRSGENGYTDVRIDRKELFVFKVE